MRLIITCLLMAVLSGCAGTSFSFDQARNVEVGMTEAEVISIMGSPSSVFSRGDHQMWVWSYANGLTGTSRAVSFKMVDGKVAELPAIPNSF